MDEVTATEVAMVMGFALKQGERLDGCGQTRSFAAGNGKNGKKSNNGEQKTCRDLIDHDQSINHDGIENSANFDNKLFDPGRGLVSSSTYSGRSVYGQKIVLSQTPF